MSKFTDMLDEFIEAYDKFHPLVDNYSVIENSRQRLVDYVGGLEKILKRCEDFIWVYTSFDRESEDWKQFSEELRKYLPEPPTTMEE